MASNWKHSNKVLVKSGIKQIKVFSNYNNITKYTIAMILQLQQYTVTIPKGCMVTSRGPSK